MQLFQGRRRLFVVVTLALIVIITLTTIFIPRFVNKPKLITGAAPDGDWTSSSWAPSNNTILGTAANTTSNVWFTGYNGIVSTVFYPSADTPNTTSLEFLVGDNGHTWVNEEQADTTAHTQLADKHSLAWQTVNIAKNKTYQIKKTIYTDPTRDSLIQQVTFTALQGTLADYLLYVYYNPTLHNKGDKNSSSTRNYNGRTVLISTGTSGNQASALAASIPYQAGMTSSGFFQLNDGLTDLKGSTRCGSDKCPDYTMNYTYSSATQGNTVQTGLLDLSNNGAINTSSATSITFNLVLAFGLTNHDVSATNNAERTLTATLNDTSDMLHTYISQWNKFDNSLNQPPAVGHTPAIQQARQQEYYLAANVLKAAQDKQTGAFVAGLGNPWGESKGDDDTGGYHLVWQRDMYEFASALLVAGDKADPQRAVQWAFDKQQQPDGHFPQNSDVSGEPYWTGIQMDEQAYPIMLAWKLGITDSTNYTKHIKPAADFIVAHGPVTGQERWEENGGYSPATIAAEISGLICAADIARMNGDTASQKRYTDTADFYQSNVVKWTYTTTGSHGNGHYFIRIGSTGNANDGASITIGNGGGTHDERDIVDTSFTELVRQGTFPANSPYITSSLAVVDATIQQTINGNHYWFRYNYDGYGEHNDGSDYDGSGTGRLWPIFSGERGLYTVAAGGDADPYLTAMMAAANSSGMIPEQVWDNQAPSGDTPGTPTKSMNPLNWAMGEYITLLFSTAQHKIVDVVPITYDRYVAHTHQP